MTICSYDNSGQLKFDVDIEMTQGYWNTSSSRLWTRIRDLMHNELVEKYNNMRQNGLSYESLMECFYDEQIAKIPQKYYNQDYDVKYAPFADSYIGMANGDTYEHLKRWLQQRLRFVDTLYDYAPSYNNDVLTIRANTTEPMTLEIETYTPVYQHLSWYNNQMDKKKINGKTSVTFTGKAMAATDQEVLIYGGSNIKSIKGITSMNPNRMLIGSATRLIELDAPNCPLLADINANKANLAPHVYLNKVNLSGCPLLGGNLIINQSPLIREIDIRNTAITGLNLPSNLRNLEVLKLPSAITNMVLNDASQLHTLELDEGCVMESVSMSNCSSLTNITNFNLENVPNITLNNSYNTVNELYLNKTTNLSVSNMPNLERVIYTPNTEHEIFDKVNVDNAQNYTVSTFNCPKLNEFVTTAPYRESYGKEYGEVKPNEVFEANTIDISNTQFTDVKLLCTTDTNVLKLPKTVKNLIVDSAYDLDTDHLIDGDYDTIHTELYEQYNTDYKDNVFIPTGESVKMTITKNTDGVINGAKIDSVTGEIYQTNIEYDDVYSYYLPVLKGSNIVIHYRRYDINASPNETMCVYEYDSNKKIIKVVPLTNPYNYTHTLGENTSYLRFFIPRITRNDHRCIITWDTVKTPNIVPSASDGSLIFSMYAPSNTVQPASGVWDLKGLELEEYHTFGLNNDIQATYGLVDTKSAILKGEDLNWSFSWGAYDSTTILNNEIASITPLIDANFTFTFFDKDGNVIEKHALINSDVKITVPENTYTIEIECYTVSTHLAEFNIVYKMFGVTQLQMPDRYDEYSSRIDNLKISNEIARYTASDVNTFPSFNTEFKYSYITFEEDGVYSYRIIADDMDNLPTSISFQNRTSLLSIEHLNVEKVTDMSLMFYNCRALTTLDSSNWDTSNAITMRLMFSGCQNLTSLDVSNWDTSNVTDMDNMFGSCSKLTSLDLSSWDTNKVTNMVSMFYSCLSLTSLDLSSFDTSKVTSMTNMFYNCRALTTLDVINWDTNKVTDMKNMFGACSKLTSLDLSSWDTSNVANMNSMFVGCEYLTTLDVSNFDTSKVTNMNSMFNCCYKLTSLDLSSWDTNKVTDMDYMFYNCNNLTSLDSVQNIPVSLSLSSTKLDQTSLVDVINNLVTVTTTQTLTLGTTLLAKLTEGQIAVAVNKGWTVE